jgi:hypothetical protein
MLQHVKERDDMDLQEQLSDLRERLARLEAAKPRRRSYNQQQTALAVC